MRVTKKFPSERFWRKIVFFDKTIYHKGFLFLRELQSIGKVNIWDKTITKLPAKRSSYAAPSHWAALELPFPCIFLFLDKSTQFNLHFSQPTVADEQLGTQSTLWDSCSGSKHCLNTKDTWCSTNHAPDAVQWECQASLQFCYFLLDKS